jgi:hypothetical protein
MNVKYLLKRCSAIRKQQIRAFALDAARATLNAPAPRALIASSMRHLYIAMFKTFF